MATYNFRISYVKGNENARANALNRKPKYLQNKTHESHTILKQDNDALVHNKPQLAATSGVNYDTIKDIIKTEYSTDATAKKILAIPDNPERGFTIEDGFIHFHDKLYIPSNLAKDYVTEQHELPAHGHQGIIRTFARIRREVYFPKMRTIAENVVGNCDICIRNKAAQYAPYGQLKTPELPTQLWKSIAWDFVVKLPLSKDPVTQKEYDSILVVTDRLTKFAHMIPFCETWTADGLAYIFMRNIVSIHGVPDEIISDRDKLFTSKFWSTLMALLGIKRKLSTAFHP
ncbi:hypothetical protein SS1G_04937 [Sclerotinia sclerotiorum 1980 UF-70]|uniref:Integrase catalytic domain-containing protein n=2 Tax=Sclerotinia sclerotiorum (strain ATCC 18683 / 1980 / Ss-1) TaxID=665079 RepID=A0A1D9Q9A3_SCLS1|nr:hypothetical protein SS1G_04937 [Sclerotinia sclerotiorum 1980 UF-70]APA11524.1 hypothetical protein sscle_08g062940 [Sclerotinia sclerotiorum 1980 UF-70]EDO02461.1 hypothetical protein SS1G_04937 [Sclerotinia sclerotiorum 1980 UF-70]